MFAILVMYVLVKRLSGFKGIAEFGRAYDFKYVRTNVTLTVYSQYVHSFEKHNKASIVVFFYVCVNTLIHLFVKPLLLR